MGILSKVQQDESWLAVQSLLFERGLPTGPNRVEHVFKFSPRQGYSFDSKFEFEFKSYGYDLRYYVIISNAFKAPSIFQNTHPKSNEILFHWNDVDKKLEFELNNQPVYIK